MKTLFSSTVTTKSFLSADEDVLSSALFDWSSYSTWNPYIRAIEGETEIGAPLQVSFHLGAGLKTTLACELIAFDKDEGHFAWLYKAGVPQLYEAIHSFRLMREGKRLALVQSEEMKGLCAGSFNWAYRVFLDSRVEAMHQAIDRYVRLPSAS